jgi:class 3 adenylate cyclase
MERAGRIDMQPWVIDAGDMDADDILGFRSNLLHPNPGIRSFLKAENKSTTIIIAPKGFGKTLLLKAKRLSMKDKAAHVLPKGALVDKPSGNPSVAPTTEYGSTRDTDTYWTSLWLISFSISILKAISVVPSNMSRSLQTIFDNDRLTSVCDIFDHVLSAPISTYHQLNHDYNDNLLPNFRQIHESVLMFVDNIDEYYEGILREISPKSNANPRTPKSSWHFAQYGIAAAARELSEINNHVKLYVSIRKEVLQTIVGESYFGQQLRGKSLIISYSHDDLIQIIHRNILNSDKEDLVDKKTEDPVKAFFGEVTRVTHPITGDEEGVLDFWIRHTLGRPRDVAAIGRALTDVPPSARSERRIRESVRGEAKSISKAYLGEMSPHLEGFDADILLPLIPKSVLSPADLNDISNRYQDAYRAQYGIAHIHTDHPFCAMFKLGLLGYVGRDAEIGEDVQVFTLPGEHALDNVCVLPSAQIYLIHPALDDLVGARNPRYFEHLDDRNIIGRERRWLRERVISYVLKGDIKGYTAIMRDAPKNRAFNEMFDSTIAEFGGVLDYAKKSEGDSLLLVDTNPAKLLQAAQNISRDVHRSEFQCEMRFGGDAGFVDIERSSDPVGLFGMAIQSAARLEPHVEPGAVFVTDEFKFRVGEDTDRKFAFTFEALGPESISKLDWNDGQFNIAKSSEDPIYSAIWRVAF